MSLPCNPYPTTRLILECEVSRERTAQSIKILWVFINDSVPINAVEPIIINDIDMEEKYTIDPTFAISIDRSKLTVNMLNDLDSGRYFCAAQFPDGDVTTPSQELQLFTSEVLGSARPDPCSQSDAQTELLETCTQRVPPTLPTLPTLASTNPTIIVSTSGEDSLRQSASSIFIGGITALNILNSLLQSLPS